MSNFVPFYVYSNIKKATEFPNCLDSGDKLRKNKANSIENIYEYFVPKEKFANKDNHLSSLPIIYSKEPEDEDYDSSGGFENHLNGYKMKIKEENRLREKIINELLTENERITENVKLNYRKSTPRILNVESDHLDHDAVFPKFDFKINNFKKADIFEELQSSVIIPQLPNGKELVIEIFSTWGDRHYVGLNGIEIFGSDGKLVEIQKVNFIMPLIFTFFIIIYFCRFLHLLRTSMFCQKITMILELSQIY